MMMNPIELMKFVGAQGLTEQEQIHALAALADAPPDDYVPKISLPSGLMGPKEIPAFKLGNGGLGSMLANQDHGVPAPVFGQANTAILSIGQLLVGEN